MAARCSVASDSEPEEGGTNDGSHKICKHKGRARDRCEHAWWGSFRGKRVSLSKWTNREISSKAEADIALDELRAAIRDGTFDERGLDPPRRQLADDVRQVRRGLQAATRAREGARAVQHHRLPAEAVDRAIRGSADRRDQDGRHRRLRRGPEAAANGQRSGRQTADPGVHQPDVGAAPSHAQLGRRPRVPRSNTLPARHRGADSDGARGQQATSANQRGGRGRAADGRVTAPAVDDHRRPGHRHAARRDAGAPVRGHRLEAADDHPAGRDDEEPTNSARPDRHRPAARRARVAPARQCGRTQGQTMSRCSATRLASR